MLVDVMSIVVAGSIGMLVIALDHPYFVLYETLVGFGFVRLLSRFRRDRLAITLKVSRIYDDAVD